MHVMAHMWMPDDNLNGSVLWFYDMASRDRQVNRKKASTFNR